MFFFFSAVDLRHMEVFTDHHRALGQLLHTPVHTLIIPAASWWFSA